MEKVNKGAIWRKWDLHIHTPETKLNPNGYELNDGNDKWINYCEIIESSDVEVFGITDYFSVENYFKFKNLFYQKYPESKKIFFPNIEFRLEVSVNKVGEEVNIHLLFNNNVLETDIKDFLSKLETNISFNGANITCDKLKSLADFQKASVKYSDLKPILKKVFGEKECYLIIAASNNQGLRADTKSPRKLNISDEIDKICDAFFGNSNNTAYFLNTERYEEREDGNREIAKKCPVYAGSDAHSFEDLNNKLGKSYEKRDKDGKICDNSQITWIKADVTFAGLKQTLVEPVRVFIGNEPDLLKRVRENQTKFIKSIAVNKIENAIIDDIWFENFKIDLNSGLVAVIGNKGNGKSAVTDIISLCGNTHQDPSNFSFLTPNKFRKSKPYNLSERFEATLYWEDNTPIKKLLNSNPDKNLPERVKYIPQNFLERLCSNIESDDFEKELKQIIYSHTPNDKRLGKSSLDELINYKSSLVNDEIAQLQASLTNLNVEISLLEKKDTIDFKKSIENQLELKKGELKAHKTTEPKKPEEVQENPESKKLVEELTLLREQIKILEDEIDAKIKLKSILTIKKEELNRANQYFNNIDEQLKTVKSEGNEYVQILTKNDIILSDVFSYNIDTNKILLLINSIETQIESIDFSISAEKDGSIANNLSKLNLKLQQDQEVLDKPAKEQQKYLDDVKTWDAKKRKIEGDIEVEGSLKFYDAQLTYLNEKLIPELKAKYELRKKYIGDLYTKKISLIEIRKELFQPVTQFINDFKELKERYDVKIDVALEMRLFNDNFFNYISQGKAGTFCGKEEGYKRLNDIIEKTHFSSIEGFLKFTEDLIENLKQDKRFNGNNHVEIINQLKKDINVADLYDYIFHANYLQPIYNLKLGNKTLQELSPGERGALLLIFYLILDNEDIPLIIDQPEENLDNESVYYILVHFIKKVKEKRQIIIVTHNPNLAIVCDADQIINMQIEKENRNRVKFISGAIEDPFINKAIVNILEGTLPAFNNRDAKYIR